MKLFLSIFNKIFNILLFIRKLYYIILCFEKKKPYKNYCSVTCSSAQFQRICIKYHIS